MCISSHIQAKSPTQCLWYVWITYHRRCLWNNRCQIEQSDELPLDLLRGSSMVVETKGSCVASQNNWSTSCPTCRWMCLCVAVQIPLVSMTIDLPGHLCTSIAGHQRCPANRALGHVCGFFIQGKRGSVSQFQDFKKNECKNDARAQVHDSMFNRSIKSISPI